MKRRITGSPYTDRFHETLPKPLQKLAIFRFARPSTHHLVVLSSSKHPFAYCMHPNRKILLMSVRTGLSNDTFFVRVHRLVIFGVAAQLNVNGPCENRPISFSQDSTQYSAHLIVGAGRLPVPLGPPRYKSTSILEVRINVRRYSALTVIAKSSLARKVVDDARS